MSIHIYINYITVSAISVVTRVLSKAVSNSQNVTAASNAGKSSTDGIKINRNKSYPHVTLSA